MCNILENKSRRNFLSSFISLFSLTMLSSNLVKAEKEFYYIQEGLLAGSFYYTKNKPERCSNVKESHVPLLRLKNNILVVSTPHEMKGYNHNIIKHIILNNKFKIFSEKNFDPSKEVPLSRHTIPGYDCELFILSVCNKHDTWLNLLKI